MAKRVAVIDIGSNSIRMVVYEKTSRFAFHILHEAKSRVILSQNAYQNNSILQEEAMQRTFEALKDFVTIINSYKARKILCVATSALRDAPNKKEFLSKVKNDLKLNIKIIDGKKEAYLGAIACANLLPLQENALTLDIGGGSSEFSLINKHSISNNISLNLGTVRLKEMFFDKDDIEGATKYIDTQLEKLDNLKIDSIVGIGGTFRAIASSIMLSSKYPLKKLHAFEFTSHTCIDLLNNILNADDTKLKELGIKSNRGDIIKSGSLILQQVLKKFHVDKLITSGVGVREGVYLSDLLRHSKDKLPLNYNTSVRNILDQHVSDTSYSNQLNKLSKHLFDLTYQDLEIESKYRYELGIAAKLCISTTNSYTLVKDSLLFGFTHAQTTLISTLTKYNKNKFPNTAHVEKYSELLPDVEQLNSLCFLLSTAISLLSHRPRNIDFTLNYADNILTIDSKNSLYLAKENIKKLNNFKNLTLQFTK